MFFGLLGAILRTVFVYKLNWKKMNKASINNKQKEKEKDIIAGAIGFVGIVVFFIIYQWLFD